MKQILFLPDKAGSILKRWWLFAVFLCFTLQGNAQIDLLQTTNHEIGSGSIACGNYPIFTSENFYARHYNLTELGYDTFEVTKVSFGVQNLNLGNALSYSVNVQIYASSGGVEESDLTYLGGQSIEINSSMNGTIVEVTLDNSITVTSESMLVVVHAPDGENTSTYFYIGSNSNGQTEPSYIKASGCEINEFVSFESIGYENLNFVLFPSGNPTLTCPEGNVTLSSQSAIDAFGVNYPNCTEINGTLSIGVSSGTSGITDLSALSNISSITNNLIINRNTMSDLAGLNSLTSVGGYLNINNNSNLQSISGLSNLISVNGYLYINNNNNLVNLDGFNILNNVGQEFQIGNNNSLTTITGFTGLESVGKHFQITNNDSLLEIPGFSALEEIGSYLAVDGNSQLNDISGLQNIDYTSIGGTYGLYIKDNPQLSVCDFDNFCSYLALDSTLKPRTISGNSGGCLNTQAIVDACSALPTCPEGDVELKSQAEVDAFGINYPNCTEISGDLVIGDEDNASDISDFTALQNINRVTGGFLIGYNPLLTNLSGFENLTSVGYIGIVENNNLINLDALSQLIEIDGPIGIVNNQNLTSISGLQNLNPDGIRYLVLNYHSLIILGNSQLSVCNLPNLCEYLVNLPADHQVQISGNLSDCISLEAVLAACTVTVEGCTITSQGLPQWPYETFLPALSGSNEVITENCWTGEYSKVNVISGVEYTFSSSVIADFITITDESGENIFTFGTGSVQWTATSNQVIRFYLHLDDECSFGDSTNRSRIVNGYLDECPSGDLTFNTQEQIDQFIIEYPYCRAVQGFLRIDGADSSNITNLNGLANIESVVGYFRVVNTSYLQNLDGLNNLESVGGLVTLGANYALTDIEGLESLSSIGEWLRIVTNPLLQSFDGLENLTTIGNEIDIIDNAVLSDISALKNATFAPSNGYGLTITDNPLLAICDYENFCAYLSNDATTHPRVIQNNAAGCESILAVNTACEYCEPNPTNPQSETDGDHINTFVTSGGIVNIDNSNSGYSTNGYGNYTDHIVSQIQGETISFTANPGKDSYARGLRIWVDWNKNGNFADDEIVFTSEEISNLDHFGSFIVPDNTPIGNYRMRVSLKYNATELDSCGFDNSNFGETEDYTLKVLVGPAGNCESYTVWRGLSWTNGAPNETTKTYIEGDYTVATNLTVCELVLHYGVLNVLPGATVTVNGEIYNTQNASNIIVQNGANLIQIEDVENIGEITVQRATTIKHLDYTIWSSPVLGQKLKAFSPYTLNNRIRIYDTTDDDNPWKAIPNPETTDFVSGSGVMFRAPNVFDDGFYPDAYSWTGNFKGIPQNGNVSYNFSNAYGAGEYQSVGNPYPSNIILEDFFDDNPNIATVHFWTNVQAPVNGNYEGNNWVAKNKMSLSEDEVVMVGQGFVVETDGLISEINFNNDMRTNTSGVFYRTMTDEKHRLWLDLSSNNQTLNQTLVGYMDGATNSLDFGIDSKLFNYSGSALYSLIENNQENYVIQGRSLPFVDSDIVPLGFRAVNNGSYTISLSNFDGLFVENQDIFIKDIFTNTTHNLKNGAYNFLSEQGIFDNRFEVVYREGSMSVTNPDLNMNWVVYKQDNAFQITTQGFEMSEVIVYDMLGRVVYTSKAEGTNHSVSSINANQVLIVKVITTDNQTLSKKVKN